ncbi:MAG: BamA/TamA family outer membrane protein [Gemmatimonas sp.]|nr:BamA/TamA family outer membrane protein [Gemmatimonas sp.]
MGGRPPFQAMRNDLTRPLRRGAMKIVPRNGELMAKSRPVCRWDRRSLSSIHFSPFAAILSVSASLALTAVPLQAQDPVVDPPSRWDLPSDVAQEVVRRLNDPSVDLREGDASVPAGLSLETDVAVLDGSLALAGSIVGDVVVVNGDARLLDGASIEGDLLVIGGEVEGSSSARVVGEIASYSARLVYERTAGRVRLLSAPRGAPPPTDREGYADFLITTGQSYNRVEGMPISFGPRLETEGSNPFRLQALGVYRTESGFTLDTDEMGYFVRADQFLGGHREYRVGASLFSLVDPIEEWQLTDLESGLATFLFHRDFRDHFERQGGSVFAAWEPTGSRYRILVEGRWEEHRTRATGSPWSVFDNAEVWRYQPVIAEGDLASIALEANYDSRNATWNPTTGWFVHGQVEQGYSVDLVQPSILPQGGAGEVIAAREFGRFTAGLLDLRRYNRINSGSRFNVRVVAGGSLTGDPLPPQRQHALGGEGSLPGYLLFRSDCGARITPVRLASDPDGTTGNFYSNYGCNAFSLLQAELRGKLSFRFRWDVGPWREDPESGDRVWDFGWNLSPDWALFADAGRGWSFDPTRPDEGIKVDVGAGVLIDRIGLYLAVPVTGGRGVNLFLRLGPRF